MTLEKKFPDAGDILGYVHMNKVRRKREEGMNEVQKWEENKEKGGIQWKIEKQMYFETTYPFPITMYFAHLSLLQK